MRDNASENVCVANTQKLFTMQKMTFLKTYVFIFMKLYP